jgi:hypothetical protein
MEERRTILKRWITPIIPAFIAGLISSANASAQDMPYEEIVREPRELKNRISRLEEEIRKKTHEIERLKAETPGPLDLPPKNEKGGVETSFLNTAQEHIGISGLIELGGVWESVHHGVGIEESQSDLNLTTALLTLEAEVNEWVHVSTTFLYEDATFDDETSIDLDVGIMGIGNTEKFPLYFVGGVMYVPFGALLTHFPDDPLIDQPLILILGMTSEKAVLLGYEYQGFSISGYAFNGDVDETGEKNRVNGFGFDAHYYFASEEGLEFLAGLSYISNIADSDGLTGEFRDTLGLNSIRNHVGGFDAYIHLGLSRAFFDVEYMTATNRFDTTEIVLENGLGAQPSVWNLEAGYNWDWGRNLEIAFKYAGSDESEGLGFPKDRYGLSLNQMVFKGVTASLGFIHDEFEQNNRDGRDDRDVVFGQIAVEF